MQVHDLLLESAHRTPEKAYLRQGSETYSYAYVAQKSQAIAGLLREEAGLAEGAHVALLSPNSADAVAAFFGILEAGCVAVSLASDPTAEQLVRVFDHSGCAAVVADARLLGRLGGAFAAASTVRTAVTIGESRRAAAGEPEVPFEGLRVLSLAAAEGAGICLDTPVRTIDVDLAAIIYTSGSTGAPKGVMLSHLNIVSNMRSIVEYLGLQASDSVMMILPHHYIYGLSLLLTHAMVGGTVVLDNRFAYPDTVLENMARTAVTGFAGVPSTFSILLARSRIAGMDLPALRYVTQAGGAMPAAVQKRVVAAVAPAKLYVMYGATEAAPRLSYVEPEDLARKWGSIGKPVPNVDLYVAGEDGRKVPAGTEGEFVARGSNIMVGYWKDPAGTEEVLRGGVYRTGDLGYEDDEGYLFVTGRARDILKVKGIRVSPREIESALLAVPAVVEASVVGVEDVLLGEAPIAFVVTTGTEDGQEEIRESLGRHLPSYMIPREVIHVEALPYLSSGKIDKDALRKSIRVDSA